MFLPWYSHAGPTGRGTIIAILPEPAPCQADDNTGQLLAPARPEQAARNAWSPMKQVHIHTTVAETVHRRTSTRRPT